MKRKVLCVFSLIAYILIFCTLLAPSVQREMRTMIDVKQIHEALKLYNHTVPKIALSWADGPQLYQVVEGKGWNTGDRIEEVPQLSYYLVTDYNTSEVVRAEIYPGKNFDIVLSASRQPVVGDAVTVVKEFQEREDIYIICYPQGAGQPDAYPNTFTKIAQNDQALLVTPMKAYSPYFEQQTLNSLAGMEAEELRAYSAADVVQFFEMLPAIALLGLFLLLGVFLWGYCCYLAKQGHRRVLLWRNVALGGSLLGAAYWVAARIKLPASLLPSDSILNFGYYRKEFQQIFAALESVGSDLLLQERSRCLWSCAGILAAGILLMAALVCIDRRKRN